MKITVLGTGMVGRTLAARLDDLGHDVVIGTRDPGATLARTEPGNMDTPPYSRWQQEHTGVRLLPFAEAAAHGQVVLNAVLGEHALEALDLVGAQNLAGKVLLDLALPLDFSAGMPPTLTVANTDSLGEQIQRAYPDTRVVKSLNTVFCQVMVDPTRIPGNHSIFVAGNDVRAKQAVTGLLGEFGWPADSIIDLGDISGARAAEMYSRLYFTLVGALGTFELNIDVVRRTT
ncbi:NADPH-dependent F420 reductase [Cellulosimicrobium sp. TH-20]|uniref:NADPH-dependent F420 reductase n=1 Tax=Cellulosimicrobium sp. TH-20 TaxID=1980001 RepID=UPI0011A133FD|nr:NAD(P)-binding domain-containing protein [Cellulosimicrobium sp. TH-20]